jgi:hypothetical protein
VHKGLRLIKVISCKWDPGLMTLTSSVRAEVKNEILPIREY